MNVKTSSKVESKKELIEQMLAKAASTPYPEEAATYQEAAERLMVRYGIEQAELNGSKAVKDTVVHGQAIFASSDYGLALLMGMNSVVLSFNTCTTLQSNYNRSGGKVLHVVGAQSDVDQLLAMVQSLEVQAMVAMKTWWKASPSRGYVDRQTAWKLRRDFLMHFGYGAASRVKEMTREAVAETPGAELVLANRKAVAEAAVDRFFPSVRESKSRISASSYGAAAAGQKAGREASMSVGRELHG